MKRAIALLFVFLTQLTSGCIEVPNVRPCPENTCFPLTSDAFNTLISGGVNFDVLDLSNESERLRVRSILIQETQNGRGEIQWDVSKDEIAELRSISTRYILGGNIIIDSEVIEGREDTNLRSNSGWFQGRDLVVNDLDPFFELAEKASMDPDGFWPPFSFDVSKLSDLSWTITGDAFSSQQVASASNGTHEIIIELRGINPQIVGIEVFSGAEYEFSLRVWMDEDVSIELRDNLPRAQVPFVPPLPSLDGYSEGHRIVGGIIPYGMTTEVPLSEIEIHALVGNSSKVSMNLESGDANITDSDGNWWQIGWLDSAPKGLFSSLDSYAIKTNSTSEFSIRFFDIWAGSWTDSQLQ